MNPTTPNLYSEAPKLNVYNYGPRNLFNIVKQSIFNQKLRKPQSVNVHQCIQSIDYLISILNKWNERSKILNGWKPMGLIRSRMYQIRASLIKSEQYIVDIKFICLNDIETKINVKKITINGINRFAYAFFLLVLHYATSTNRTQIQECIKMLLKNQFIYAISSYKYRNKRKFQLPWENCAPIQSPAQTNKNIIKSNVSKSSSVSNVNRKHDCSNITETNEKTLLSHSNIANQKWICQKCTLINETHPTICEMCKTPTNSEAPPQFTKRSTKRKYPAMSESYSLSTTASSCEPIKKKKRKLSESSTENENQEEKNDEMIAKETPKSPTKNKLEILIKLLKEDRGIEITNFEMLSVVEKSLFETDENVTMAMIEAVEKLRLI
eukprot:15173_1